jgi:hypothetical protein
MFQQQRQANRTIANSPSAVSSSIVEPTVQILQRIVQLHQVCYEVWPEWSGCGGRARRIGYCIEICGVIDRHDCVHGHHVPGCIHCSATYEELREIADWITRTDQEDCRLEIEEFDRAWHIAPRLRWSRNEIVVSIRHYHDVDANLGDSQERCLKQLRGKLQTLGVREDVWHPGTVPLN